MKLFDYHKNPAILHVNTMENRSYYIPLSKEEYQENRSEGTGRQTSEKNHMNDCTKDYMDSNRLKVLNGQWKFGYYTSPYEVPDHFYKNENHSDHIGDIREEERKNMNTIEVPSCIQMKGYDKHQYTNIRYPFPYDPPYVPEENPCGTYVRDFTLTKEQCNYEMYLNFEGVDSCFYVWLNDEFVGYSQVSHSTSEFNVTPYIRTGNNRIGILVLKWCDGSYLEDQDKFRMTGIFRDVYLLFRPKNHIRDYRVNTSLDLIKDVSTISLSLEYSKMPVEIECSLYSPSGACIKSIHNNSLENRESLEFYIEKPILWNAEQPNLYTLVMESKEEVLVQKVGIRKIEVKDGIVLLNGVAIKLKGVNRHDSDPYTGYTISRAQALKDLSLMKEHNVNAIRTSHYPNAPWFIQLCDRYGFYVVGESDIEAHGTASIYGGDQMTTFGDVVQLDIFYDAILDRVKRNVIRDKNATSVVIWSLGNEAGYGKSLEDAGRWVKEYDNSRLLQYESSIYETGGHKNDTSMLDIYSRMYATIEEMDQYIEKKENKKPFLLIEFVHSMGNGPGDMEDYYEKIYKSDRFCGGFVWEWCDHAIYTGKTITGKDKFDYGGDFKEFPHDGNFCVDGLVYPDRKVSPSLMEYKNVIRPVRAYEHNLELGQIRLFNHLDFTNLMDEVILEYVVTSNGEIIQKGIIEKEQLNIPPKTDKIITFDYKIPEEGLCHLLLTYKQKKDKAFTKAGHVLGYDQLLLKDNGFSLRNQLVKLEGDKKKSLEKEIALTKDNAFVDILEDDKYVFIKGEDYHYTFNKWNGVFEELNYQNNKILSHSMNINIWRAPTDNDIAVKEEWRRAGYDRSTTRVYQVDTVKKEDGVELSVQMSIGAIYIQRILELHITYLINQSGEIDIKMMAEKNMELPFLPRFGLRFFVPKEYEEVTYFGYGPYESYVDKRRASYFGRFKEKVSHMHEDYIKPQENSSHYGTKGIILEGKNRVPIIIEPKDQISFHISKYIQEELGRKAHNYELEEFDSTEVCIDYKMSGIGSQSCGPRLLEKYQLNEPEFQFEFKLYFGK